MANISVPRDGRAQFDPATVMVTNALMGRWVTAGVETMTPGGSYILKNSWPPSPPMSPSRPAGPVIPSAPSSSSDQEAPRNAAHALWPDLR
jgi:hypothetical protein